MLWEKAVSRAADALKIKGTQGWELAIVLHKESSI